MQLTDDQVKEFNDIYEKEHGKRLPQQEAWEAAHNLVNFFKVLLDIETKERQRKLQLEQNPKGFDLTDGTYSCCICGAYVSGDTSWYDKYGIKCLVCQKAIDKKIIPGSAAKNKDSWYSTYDLQSRFNLNHHAVKKFVKEGVLKPRVVPNPSGRPHVQIFLIKDNKDTLPPKKLTESQSVKETRDGKDWYHSEPWYKFVDPREALKGYKIMDYLVVTNSAPEEQNGTPD